MNVAIASRRTGDQLAIPGDYQYRVYQTGWAAQRYWHHAKLLEAERWLQGAEAADIGFDEALPELVERSQAAITAVKQAQEAARQCEVGVAHAAADLAQRTLV